MGVTACIAETPEVYVDIAVRLATDAAYGAEIRQLILQNVDKLYEQVQTVRELESFIIKAVRGTVLS
jgi:predicted O-linked N-acetylglucosamine transferase (SPINDLY family)